MKKIFLLFFTIFFIRNSQALNPSDFSVTQVTAPFFIVDGNAPNTITSAYVGFKITNISSTTHTGLYFSINNIASSVIGQNYAVLSPTSNFVIVGTLAGGQSKVCYFFISYPPSVTPVATFNTSLNDNTSSNKTASFTIANRFSISSNAGGAATQNFASQDLAGGIITDSVTYTVGNSQSNDEVDFQVSVSSLFDPAKMILLSTRVAASDVPGVAAGTTDRLYFRTGNGGVGQKVSIVWTFRIAGFNFTSYLLPCAGATSGSSNYKYTLNSALGTTGTPIVVGGTPNPITITKTSNKSNYAPCETAFFTIEIYNPGPYGISVDSIQDQLPSGFSYIGFTSSSDINESIATRFPSTGSTGNICFWGDITSGANSSFFIPASGRLKIVYSATARCSFGFNLSTTASGFIGSYLFDSDVNTVDVISPLPVKWISFSATKQEAKNIMLKWSVISSQNGGQYAIENSADCKSWEIIHTIQNNYRMNIAGNFEYLHSLTKRPINYYRIKSISSSGEVSYSPIEKVIATQNFSSIIVIGNPVLNKNLLISLKGSGILKLSSPCGNLLYKKSLYSGLQCVDLSRFSSGTYLLQFNDEIKKIILQ